MPLFAQRDPLPLAIDPAVASLLGQLLVGYFVAMLTVSVYASRRVQSEADDLVAGRRLPLLLVAGTLVATWFDAAAPFAASAAGHAPRQRPKSARRPTRQRMVSCILPHPARAKWSESLHHDWSDSPQHRRRSCAFGQRHLLFSQKIGLELFCVFGTAFASRRRGESSPGGH